MEELPTIEEYNEDLQQRLEGVVDTYFAKKIGERYDKDVAQNWASDLNAKLISAASSAYLKFKFNANTSICQKGNCGSARNMTAKVDRDHDATYQIKREGDFIAVTVNFVAMPF